MTTNYPNWEWDEVILLLDLANRIEASPLTSQTPEVTALSDTLRQMRPSYAAAEPTYRNSTGVLMTLMNLKSLDRHYSGRGLARAGSTLREVFKELGDKPEEVAMRASAIRQCLDEGVSLEAPEVESEKLLDGREGALVAVQHFRRERNAALVNRVKQQAWDQFGRLSCEGCGFDFAAAYGQRGVGFIEVHHTAPLSEAPRSGGVTHLSDLSLVCANCHRMIHRFRPWISISELKSLFRASDSIQGMEKLLELRVN